MKYNKGLIIGKFYPFHKGHEFLIESSIQKCDHLTVLVCSLQKETIPGEIRFKWVTERFPNINIIHVKDENPQYPEDDPDFWNIWKSTIKRNHPEKIDVLFSSENYGEPLAKVLNCANKVIDLNRTTFPISGTKIRNYPLKNWDFIADNVKYYFVKKIVITGPESTGKTTLAKFLSEYFQTNWVHEYAREYLGERNNDVTYETIEPICKGHIELEDKLIKSSNKFLIVDTDPIITKMYSSIYFNKVPEFVLNQAKIRNYDLHIVLSPDVPWVSDPLRDLPEYRNKFLEDLFKELKYYNKIYELVSGNFSEREKKAISIIENHFLN